MIHTPENAKRDLEDFGDGDWGGGGLCWPGIPVVCTKRCLSFRFGEEQSFLLFVLLLDGIEKNKNKKK